MEEPPRTLPPIILPTHVLVRGPEPRSVISESIRDERGRAGADPHEWTLPDVLQPGEDVTAHRGIFPGLYLRWQ